MKKKEEKDGTITINNILHLLFIYYTRFTIILIIIILIIIATLRLLCVALLTTPRLQIKVLVMMCNPN